MSDEPRSVIVKIMVVDRPADAVFDFFADPRNWESGGALRNVRQDGDWWLADSPAGTARIRLHHNRQFGISDHDFVGGGEWRVFSRITPNERGTTVSWTFLKPKEMTHAQFEGQLRNFDKEIEGWKSALESAR